MRALLYQNLDPQFQPANLIDEAGPVIEAERFAPFIEEAQQHPVEQVFKISWQRDKSSADRGGKLLGDHDGRNIGIAARYGRHHGRVRYTQAAHAVNAALGVYHRIGVVTRAHSARAADMESAGDI